ncbi:uncharacterized protein LOC110851027 [Folsomia candida]|uniref:uncharacterized protein LOC110851027 n=1 Tax=Folsomia candida TaxID=158441 RepID=UPI001604EAA5|nr:uncharacterized protein LOC110851027 [Folsomia candida]
MCLQENRRGWKGHEFKKECHSRGLSGVAEVLRHRGRVKLEEPFMFGGLHLADTLAGVEFIRKNVKVILDEERASFSEYIRFGEIFGGILPYQFRDYKMAEEFYMKAHSKMPSNSKINHKVGVLYLTCDELRDIPQSINFLRCAVENEMSNIFAALDMIRAMMSSVTEHLTEIEQVIQLYFKRIEEGLASPTKSELSWILGCAKFMGSDKEGAVRAWISGQKLSPNKNIFTDLIPTIKRYQWDRTLISLNLVKSTLENSLTTCSDADDIVILQNMIETLPTPVNRGTFQRRSLPGSGGFNFTNRGGRQESDLDNNWRRYAIPSGDANTTNNNARRGGHTQARSSSPANWR